ncbi:universal stress protein [Chitinophaga sp. LS1]|uniref:universal stress protein n=1 Tax=Chitinophaga sp. LS1 TaxID=3051176 RepID=UPI002AAA9B0F|nr:universal stress protein [Chitinophaga sp. LS1]WPV64626.1 universal stress protein [Chitinophaga sp. LS1]
MKKILYVTDALDLHLDNLDFAGYICELAQSKLLAVFLENDESEMRTDSMIRTAAVNAGLNVTEEPLSLKQHTCDTNIQRFKTACEIKGIDCVVHRDRGNPLSELILESRYADLLLLNVSTTFSPNNEGTPTDFVKDVMSNAECPVMLMPASFNGIGEIVFTYDGKPSSIHAIKQFTYLFPQLNELKTVVVSVNPEEVSPEERYKFREWMHAHYNYLDFLSSEGNVKMGLVELLFDRDKSIVVMGAYGRSMISNFLSPSHANPVIKVISQAVFIAHN